VDGASEAVGVLEPAGLRPADPAPKPFRLMSPRRLSLRFWARLCEPLRTSSATAVRTRLLGVRITGLPRFLKDYLPVLGPAPLNQTRRMPSRPPGHGGGGGWSRLRQRRPSSG